MTEHEIEALHDADLIARALEWFAAHGHEHADLVERVVDTYLWATESAPAA